MGPNTEQNAMDRADHTTHRNGVSNHGYRPQLLVIDKSGSGIVHFFQLDPQSERIVSQESKTTVWGHTQGLRDFGVAILDNHLYIVGGHDTKERQCSGRITRYNPMRNQWDALAPMNIARSKFGAASLDGCIYITGGVKSDGKSTGSCEVYDPEKDSWRRAGMLPAPRKDHSVISYDHSIYLSGGFQGRSGHRNLWTYEDQQWKEADVDCPQELACPRERHTTVRIDNTIYFIGGVTYDAYKHDGEIQYVARYEERVESFKPRVVASSHVNKLDLISPWTWDLFRLKVPRFNAGAVPVGKRIYIIGGTNPDNGGCVLEVECFDTDKNRCFTCFTLPKGNFHNVVCLVLNYPLETPCPDDVIDNQKSSVLSLGPERSPDVVSVQDKAGKWVLW